jgi:signal transduction histidine kinase
VPILDPGAERDRVNGLRREIDAFRSTLLDVLDSDRARWRSQARLILGLVMPRRTSVMQLSDNIQTLNRSTFVQHQQAITVVYARMQRQVWQTLGFAVVASLGIALFATVCVGRLERDLQQKRLKERQTTEDLQRLSTKLVSAQEEERRTIARELHDEIGQVLMAIKVELTLAQRRLDTAGVHGRLLDDAQSITDGALVTVRDLSHLLHPAVLDDFGLSAALESYVTGFTRRYDIPVEMLHDGVDERLLPEIEAGVYRIVQEALTNVAKHANATMGVVYLRCAGNVLHVSIEDDGVGFEPDGPRRGLGLIGIRERVAHLEGTVRIDSAPCRGTRLSIEVPARTRVRVPAPHELDVANSAVPLTPGEVLLG